MSEVPSVTVLIPARNEEADIERCLRAVLDQDHPHDRMEIVLVDGGSVDRTVELATRVLEAGDVDWRIIENPVGTTPSNLNAGLAVASGEIVCRVDARSIVPAEYVRLCADVLSSSPEIRVTGGAQAALTLNGSPTSAGIARALNNTYAMGGARYRAGAPSGASDTVYLGAFRTDELRAAGGWNDYLETNQDYELNRRMGRDGVVWFDDRLVVGYIPRQTLPALWKQYQRFGRWKVRYWRLSGDRPQQRQVIAIVGFSASVLSCVGYLAWSRGRPRAVLGTVLTAACAGLAVDYRGNCCPAPMSERITAVVAMTVTSTGWVLGIARESASGMDRARRQEPTQ